MGACTESAQDHGGASAYRGNGKVDREPRSDQNERGIALERVEVIAVKSSKSQAPTFGKIPNYALGFGIWSLADGAQEV